MTQLERVLQMTRCLRYTRRRRQYVTQAEGPKAGNEHGTSGHASDSQRKAVSLAGRQTDRWAKQLVPAVMRSPVGVTMGRNRRCWRDMKECGDRLLSSVRTRLQRAKCRRTI